MSFFLRLLLFSLFFFFYDCGSDETNSTLFKPLGPGKKPNKKIAFYPPPKGVRLYPLREILSPQEAKDIFDGYNPVPSTKKKNIVFFMIDALRNDYISKEDTPNVYKFSQESSSVHLNRMIANGVTTYFSTLSFFFGILGYARPYMIGEDNYDFGALNLKILKKHGYKLSLFSRSNNYFCFKEDHKNFTNQYENSKFLFSNKPYEFIDGSCTQYKPGKGLVYADADHASLSRFKKNSPQLFSQNDKNVFLFFLDGAHTPYSFSKKGLNSKGFSLEYPYMKNVKAEVVYKDPQQQKVIINSYKNAIRSADYQFGRLVATLKKQGVYEETDIIVFSDHGERLFEPHHQMGDRNRTGHSGVGYNELIRPVTIMKLSNIDQKKRQMLESLKSTLASQKDVFPTLFECLGITYPENLKGYVLGQNLLKEEPYKSQVNYAPNWDRPPYFTFVNDKLKVYVRFYRPQEKSGHGGFEIIHYFDLNDRLISKEKLQSLYQVEAGNKESESEFLYHYFKEALAQIVKIDS